MVTLPLSPEHKKGETGVIVQQKGRRLNAHAYQINNGYWDGGKLGMKGDQFLITTFNLQCII